MATLPTDFTAWNFKSALPVRLMTGITAAMATLTPISPGAMTATFHTSPDATLKRMGRGNLPETSSVAVSVPGWEDVAAPGFAAPVELTTAHLQLLDDNTTFTWVSYDCIDFIYGHPSTNAASNYTQLAFEQYYHALVEGGSPDPTQRGPKRRRINNTAGVAQGQLQSNIVLWSGSVASQSVATYPAISLATLGADNGGVRVELLEEFGYDKRLADLGVTYPCTMRTTAKSTRLSDGAAVQAATQVDHWVQNASTPTLPRLPAGLVGSDGYLTLGRAKDIVGTPHGMQGDFRLVCMAVRDAAAGMLAAITVRFTAQRVTGSDLLCEAA